MNFVPLALMLDRVERFGNDSDSTAFTELLYAGEFIVKTTTAAFVSAIEDDKDNQRYRLLHGLVRTNGLGEWAQALDDALTGPASQHLADALKAERKAFTERLGEGSWQYEAIRQLHEVLVEIDNRAQELSKKSALQSWFHIFAEVRNKTRGHGAPTPALCAKLLPNLQDSIKALCENNPICNLSWAYLHRNLSGKYKVVALGGDPSPFDNLKSNAAVGAEHYPDGVYLWSGKCTRVELIHTDVDASDFFLPNGAFRSGRFELHSLITDNRLLGDAAPYTDPAGERPPSETEGRGDLSM